ncbi:hypothetical protein [Halanaerobium salsuginis]|uniref:Uncharacterized protein n=1 Tax=Halanaerobium salsuginis TaxID=29563 RepID=A0A1I4F013_9FIRM|nr:hypothetical protein [Halanaerobium salsuginis]SFL09721.1 hypothetical protein SAMN02983006_00172 [Halanaerobium salsuginis]
MMVINKKLAIILVVMILSIGIATGTVLTADEQLDNLAASEQTIDEKVEKAIEEKFAKEQANMQLYEAIYYDKKLDQTMYFFFRSDDNPFWRANEIMEIKGKEFSNLRIRESDLLEEEK